MGEKGRWEENHWNRWNWVPSILIHWFPVALRTSTGTEASTGTEGFVRGSTGTARTQTSVYVLKGTGGTGGTFWTVLGGRVT